MPEACSTPLHFSRELVAAEATPPLVNSDVVMLANAKMTESNIKSGQVMRVRNF